MRLTTGFTGFTFERTAKDSSGTIAQISPLQAASGARTPLGLPSSYEGGSVATLRSLNLREQVRMAIIAYNMDGMVRQVVDRHSEQFKDFSFKGGEAQIKAISDRLSYMSLKTGEHWKTTMTRIIDAFFASGNSFVFKLRGNVPGAKRPVYKDKPYALIGLRLVSADRVDFKMTKDGQNLGLSIVDQAQRERYSRDKLIIDKSVQLPPEQARARALFKPKAEENIYVPGLDFCQIAYHKMPDCHWGAGLTFAGLEDIGILRTLESTIAVLIKKYSTPLLHHKIARIISAQGAMQTEIDKTIAMYRQAAPDGVIVTGANHEIKSLGAESHALRAEGYLDYWGVRACVGLGASPEIIGLRPSNLGTGQMAQEKLMARVRYCQALISRELEFFIFNEILWESGYDPYTNPDDEVHIEFTDIDEDRMIKLQTHAADLNTKNLVDSDQAMDIARGNMHKAFQRAPQPSKMYTNQHAIPLKKAGPPRPATAASKRRPKKRTSKREFADSLLAIWPATEREINDFCFLLQRLYSFEESQVLSCKQVIHELLHDDLALIEFLYQRLVLNQEDE
jgi:hypothetical protein